MSDIYIFKLVTGETIIANVLDHSGNVYTLDTPMVINESIDERSQQTAIILSKYNSFDDTQISVIGKNHIVSVSNVMGEMVAYYHNSIKFTQKIIDPKLDKMLKVVNKQIREYLSELEMEEILETNIIPFSSNTLH